MTDLRPYSYSVTESPDDGGWWGRLYNRAGDELGESDILPEREDVVRWAAGEGAHHFFYEA